MLYPLRYRRLKVKIRLGIYVFSSIAGNVKENAGLNYRISFNNFYAISGNNDTRIYNGGV